MTGGDPGRRYHGDGIWAARRINFDANAGLGLLPPVREGLKNLFNSGPGLGLNPSSLHFDGQRARALIEEARRDISGALGLSSQDKLVFTSGATEANNSAIYSVLFDSNSASAGARPEFICSAIEHPCVLEAYARLELLGYKVAKILPDRGSSEISVDSVLSQLSGKTRIVSVMLANNETGQILPVKEITRAIRAQNQNILVHCDAAQAIGKIPFSFSDLGADIVTISGHKIGGLCGAGALILRAGVDIPPLLVGGPQEQRRRAGTENVLGIAAFGLAARELAATLSAYAKHAPARLKMIRECIKSIIAESHEALPNVLCLPNTVCMRIPGVKADDLVVALDLEGVSISSGAACSSGKPQASHVLLAQGFSPSEAKETIRISLPPSQSEEDFDGGVKAIERCLRRFC